MSKLYALKDDPRMIAAQQSRGELQAELDRIDGALRALDAKAGQTPGATRMLDRALRAVRGEAEPPSMDESQRAELLGRRILIVDGMAEAERTMREVVRDASQEQWRERAPDYLAAIDGLIQAQRQVVNASAPFEALIAEVGAMGLESNPAVGLPLRGDMRANPTPKEEAQRQVDYLTQQRQEIEALCMPKIGARRVTVRALTDLGQWTPGALVPMTMAEACQLRRSGRAEIVEA